MAKGEGAVGRTIVPVGSRTPLLVTLIVIGVVAAGYFAYYRNQVAYYTGRNLRLLSMLTEQVDGRVEMFAGFLRTSSNAAEIRRGVEESADGWRLRLQAHDTPVGPPSAEGCASLDDLLRPIFARRVGGAFDVLLVASADGTVLYDIRPPGQSSRLLYRDTESDDHDERALALRPCRLAQEPEQAPTDDALISRTLAPPTTVATTEPAVTTPAASLLMTKLSAAARKTGWRGKPEPLDLAALTTATEHIPVTINGDDYVLFSEPYTFSRGAAGVDGKAQQWILCGLVSASRFRYDVTAVSMNVILFAIAVALFAICCWPFLRIALISPSQALTITDVVLVVICTIVGAAVLTLALLDAFGYRNIAESADQQLMRYGEGINDDFARNVGRAVDVLTRIETLTKDTAKAPRTKPVSYEIPAEVKSDSAVATYPYVETVSWIDGKGMQQVKFSRVISPAVPVAARRYFKETMEGRSWVVEERAWRADQKAWVVVKRQPYVLEWVRSMATGDVRAVIAKRTGDDDLPVIALGTELIDISKAIAPPGVEMAIIDENGEVVYHTDTQRIGYENFFAEADQARDLRSAVIARRSGYLSASYWGEDQSMYVRPLNGSPWTLVTFRAKRVTRVLNVEGVLLTLMLLLLSATPYLVLYVAVLMLAPGYRAPRLWPDAARWSEYLRICVLLLALIVLFRINNYALTPWSSFYGGLILPGLAIVTTYLVLHRHSAPRRFAIAVAVWLVANALVLFFFLTGDLEDRFFADVPAIGKAVLVLTALAVAALTMLLLSEWKGGPRVAAMVEKLRSRIGYAALYRLCGVLLLIVAVAMAVACFFRISRHVESELLVKYAQLRAAADLEHRIDHLHAMSISNEDSAQMAGDVRYERFANVFGSNWSLYPPLPQEKRGTQPDETSCEPRRGDWTIPPSAAKWLPALYEDSIAIRPLFEAQSADDLWHWCLNEPFIKLVRRIRFDPELTRRLWGKNEETQSIVITSPLRGYVLDEALTASELRTRQSLTQSSPIEAALEESASASFRKFLSDKPRYYSTVTLITLLLLGAFWYAADFIATRVLLIDVGEPSWLVRLPLSPTLGDHIFLVRRERKIDALTGLNPMGKGLPFLDVSFETMDRDDSWSSMLERLDGSAAGRNVRVVDFEYGINDATINDRKLQWLERLLELPDRTVIVVSTVSATYLKTTPPPPQALRAAVLWYYDRWRALLDRFVWVTAEELELRGDARLRPSGPDAVPMKWLDRETAYNSFLRRLRDELDEHSDRRHLIDEISERAETYYAGLWASCHENEKLLLYNLAHNGLANQRNRRVLRRLMARGFVRRDPNLQLFSETFRLYVLAAARREDLVNRARELRGASTWDTLRIPFFVVIIAFLLLLFTTQKDLMTTTTALATALTTGIPMMMKLIGSFTERRLETSEK